MPEPLIESIAILGQVLVLAGALLCVLGAVGVIRFPDVYTRIHAASITDTGGATLVLLGLGLQAHGGDIALKLGIAWAFIMLTSPTASHALGNAAFTSGVWPWIGRYEIVRSSPDMRGEDR